ncbi:MAG: hypothetical protein ACUVUG_01930 [Candidatus Aminicenantia bacterium]
MMSFNTLFYGILIPVIIFLISLLSTILLYKKFSNVLKDKGNEN